MPHILEKVKNYLGDDSQIKQYLPILQQDLNEKVQRIIGDPTHHNKKHSLIQPSLKQQNKSNNNMCYDPMMNRYIVWYCFVFQAIIFYFTQVTIVLTFGQEAWQAQLGSPAVLVLNVVYIAVFIADVWVQFNVGYITNNAIILNSKRVKYRYTHYYFYFDVLLIIVIVIALAVGKFWLNYMKILALYKFMRMFEIDAIMMRKLTTWIKIRLVYQISKQFVTVYVLSQLWGIFFYIIDNNLLNQPICQGANSGNCWLNSSTAWSPISSLDWNLQYFYTLYWGVNTMCQISYGDIAPGNPTQTPWALAGMCFGFVVYSYIVNNIVKAIIWAKLKRDQFRVDLVIFDTYMSRLKVPMDKQYEIVNFLKKRFRQQQNRNLTNEDLMKSTLPQNLKIQLTRNAYGHLAQGLDYFLNCQMAVTRMLFNIKQKKFSQNQKIIYQGAPLDDLCFMYKGKVKISCQHIHQHYLICQLNLPQSFIAAYQFFLNKRSSYSVTSTQDTICYYINRQIFDNQCVKDYEFKQNLHTLEYQLFIRKKINKIFYNCYFCREQHQWYECPKTFPTFKEIKLSKMRQDQIYGKVRVINTKHKTWKDYQNLQQLNRIVKRNKDRMLSRLENRIFDLKYQMEKRKQILQVDVAYDWPIYLPEQNLIRCKQEWNKKLDKRKTMQFNFKVD